MNLQDSILRILALVVFFAWSQPSIAQEPKSLEGKLRNSDSVPIRKGPLAGCAAIAERVSPSIVTIFTTKTLPNRASMPPMDLFNDPLFKRFFDQEGLDEAERPSPKVEGLGSGVVITSDGYLVTNNHVVDGADEIKVRLPGNQKNYKARVIGSDSATDIAVLKIDADHLYQAELGNSGNLKVGDTVIAIGNPFGLDHTVTMGIVSALGRNDLNITGYENFIQTDASINMGNSGGALVDNNGSIVGINTAILSGGTGGSVGIGFAIPVNMVRDIAKQLVANGVIRRGYLGVMLSDVTESLAKAFQVEAKGALVNEVVPKSPAEQAGITAGDIIVEYCGQSIEDVAQLRLLVANTQPNQRADCVILRDGKSQTLHITTGQLSTDGIKRSGQGPSSEPDELLPGVMIEELTTELRTRFKIDEAVEGVVVTSVGADAPVEPTELRQGDVIVEINQTKVSNVQEAFKARKEAPKDLVLLRVSRQGRTRYLAVETK